MIVPLLDNQTKVKQKLSKVKVGAFFMAPGTGKTRPVVELVRELSPDFVLYLAPYRTINTKNYNESVRYQVDLWGGFSCEAFFAGIESVSMSDKLYLELHNKIKLASKPVIIVDESLKIKNADAKRTKRVIELSRYCEYKYILNGTPLSKNLLDLWSQLNFLSPKILNMDIAEFKNNFCEYKQLTIRKNNTYKSRTREWIVKYHNLDYLYKLIEPFVFECDLQLDVGLSFINVSYSLNSKEKTEHKRIMEEVLNDDWLRAKPNFFLSLTQKLQNNYSRNTEKIKIVSDILKDNPKALIVAKYIETQEVLKNKFPNARILSWQKDAFGLNLQNYNKMILFDQHWDYSLFDQIIKRIYRQRQKNDCTIWRLVGDVGLEKLMYQNVNRKEDLLQEFKKLSLEEFKNKVK